MFSDPETPGPGSRVRIESPPDKVRCGDCRMPVSVFEPGSDQPTQSTSSGDYYCPLCARAVSQPLRCNHCGSTICRHCGTPLELADELAIG